MKLSEMIKSNCCGVVLDKQEAIKELQKLEEIKRRVIAVLNSTDGSTELHLASGGWPEFKELMELF